MGKRFTRYKEIVKNICIECGEECVPVQIARTKWTKEKNIPSGMMWRCKNEHIHRTRNHQIDKQRIG